MGIRAFALMLVAAALVVPAALADDVKIVLDTSRPYKPGDRVEVKVIPAPGVAVSYVNFWIGGRLDSTFARVSPKPGEAVTEYVTIPEWVKTTPVTFEVNPTCVGGQEPRVLIPGIQIQGTKVDRTPPVLSNVKISEDPKDRRTLKYDFDIKEDESGVFTVLSYSFDNLSKSEQVHPLCSPTHCSGTLRRFDAGLKAKSTIHLTITDKAGNPTDQEASLELTDLSGSERPGFRDVKIARCDSKELVFTFAPAGSPASWIRVFPHLQGGGTGSGSESHNFVASSASGTCSGELCTVRLVHAALFPSRISDLSLDLRAENGQSSKTNLLADTRLGPLFTSCLDQVPVRGGASIREVDVKHADPVIRGESGDQPKVVVPVR